MYPEGRYKGSTCGFWGLGGASFRHVVEMIRGCGLFFGGKGFGYLRRLGSAACPKPQTRNASSRQKARIQGLWVSDE